MASSERQDRFVTAEEAEVQAQSWTFAPPRLRPASELPIDNVRGR